MSLKTKIGVNLMINEDIRSLQEILIDCNLCLSKNPQGTDKGIKSYINRFYDKVFKKYVTKPVRLLEIGFRHGASLALWSIFFDKTDSKIIGVDNCSDLSITNDSQIVKEWINRPNIEICLGDAYDLSFSKSITGKFDIIIDDGPHSLISQMKAIDLYVSKLNKGGILIIEDILIGGLAILPLMKLTFTHT